MFYLPARGCSAPAANFSHLDPQNICFTVFKLLGHQKRRVFLCLGRNGSDGQACHVFNPRTPRPCRRPGILYPSRTCVLQCLSSWAIKNVVFSYVWGVMAPMGKLVTCLGRLGRQNRIKGSRRVCFGGHCLLFFRERTIS